MIALPGPDLDPHIYQDSYFSLWPSELNEGFRNIHSQYILFSSKVWWEAAGRLRVPAVEGKEIPRPATRNLFSINESSSFKQVNSLLSGLKQSGLNCVITTITPCWNSEPTGGAKARNLCHCLYLLAARRPLLLRNTLLSFISCTCLLPPTHFFNLALPGFEV